MKFYQTYEYQPQCEQMFYRYKALLLELLPKARVEHIGASSIKNCISKGDLDIYAGVERSVHEEAVKILEGNGFKVKPNTLRTKNLCMLEDDKVAIQLVVDGSEFEDFLIFRNILNEDAALVEQYNQMKIGCAGMKIQSYRLVKSQFIEKILKAYKSLP
jgi:GrpB-like predicted nucleotidyltransferase (UPF0157 family)